VYLVWTRKGYRLIWEDPVPVPAGGNREEKIWALTEGWTRALERAIRRWPDQWVWFHRRWRTKPAAGPG